MLTLVSLYAELSRTSTTEPNLHHANPVALSDRVAEEPSP